MHIDKNSESWKNYVDNVTNNCVEWVKDGGFLSCKDKFTPEELCDIVTKISYSLKDNEDALKYIITITDMIKTKKLHLD